MYDWVAATLPEDGTEPPGWQRFLLVRRSLTRNAKGELELTYHLCAARPEQKTRSLSGPPGPAGPLSSLIPVTLAEVRRLLTHLTTATLARTTAWAWST